MDINIQTQFNIGDKVWAPDLYYDWCPSSNEREVISIHITITSDGQTVFYTTKNYNGHTDKYPAKMCFSSYDKCKQWCDNQNKGEKT